MKKPAPSTVTHSSRCEPAQGPAAAFDTPRVQVCASTAHPAQTGQSLRLSLLGAMVLVTLLGCARTQPTISTLPVSEPSRRNVMDRIVGASVKVVVERDGHRLMYGSGIVVASQPRDSGSEPVSYVLTAAHVVAAAEGGSVSVGFCGSSAGQGKFPATVISQGKPDGVDLALLRVSGIAVQPAGLLDEKRLYLGERILVVGFPEGQRLGVSAGIVSQLPLSELQSGIPSDRADVRIVIDAAAPRGVSGGGVFDTESGELIGIVQGYQTYTVGLKDQTQSYALKVPIPGSTFVFPLAQIRPFLATSEVAKRLPGRSSLTTKTISSQQ